MEAVMKNAGNETPAGSIVFSLPVTLFGNVKQWFIGKSSKPKYLHKEKYDKYQHHIKIYLWIIIKN